MAKNARDEDGEGDKGAVALRWLRMKSEADISEASNSAHRPYDRNLARIVDGEKIEIDPVRLGIARIEGQHAVIEPACKGHWNVAMVPASRFRLAIIRYLYPGRNSGYKPASTKRGPYALFVHPPRFRVLLKPAAAIILPGVSNALAARVAADLGFSAAYITGAGIANTYLGIPDNGLVTLSELATTSRPSATYLRAPSWSTPDTGFGNCP